MREILILFEYKEDKDWANFHEINLIQFLKILILKWSNDSIIFFSKIQMFRFLRATITQLLRMSIMQPVKWLQY